MNEVDWARSRPSNIQHGQKRRHPVRPLDVFWVSVAAIIIAGVVVFVAVSAIGGGT